MSRIFNFSEKQEPQVIHNTNVSVNYQYSKNWYQRKKWLQGMRASLSDAGSPNMGTIKKSVLTISFTVPHGMKGYSISQPVFLGDDPNACARNLEDVYKTIFEHAKKCLGE